MTAPNNSTPNNGVSTSLRLILVTAMSACALVCVTAVAIVIMVHGGLNSANTNILSILVMTVFASFIPNVINLIMTGRMINTVSNGLIPQKVKEAVQDPETQGILGDVVTSAVTNAQEETDGTIGNVNPKP